jgi:hypothetical protein
MIEETMILTKSGEQAGLTHGDSETYDENSLSAIRRSLFAITVG